jgi:hypothetical protein
MESLLKTTQDTEQVVVIGYSFPFFNRQTDREIFGSMANLTKIYVQDMMAFIESYHRNPSKHRLEEHAMLNWVKQQRKLHNAEAARYPLACCRSIMVR